MENSTNNTAKDHQNHPHPKPSEDPGAQIETVTPETEKQEAADDSKVNPGNAKDTSQADQKDDTQQDQNQASSEDTDSGNPQTTQNQNQGDGSGDATGEDKSEAASPQTASKDSQTADEKNEGDAAQDPQMQDKSAHGDSEHTDIEDSAPRQDKSKGDGPEIETVSP